MAEANTRLAALLQGYIGRNWPKVRSYADLAKQIGLSHATIYAWINGERRPEMSTLALVSEKTGIPLNELLEAAGYPIIETEAEVDAVFNFIIAEARTRGIYQGAALDEFIAHMDDLRAAYKAALGRRKPNDSRPKLMAGV